MGLSENCKAICFLVTAATCLVIIICTIAGSLCLAGDEQNKATATLNGTIAAVAICESSCSDDFEYGKYCHEDFIANMTWNYANQTFSKNQVPIHWSSESITCRSITAGATLSVFVRKDRPEEAIGFQPAGTRYNSALLTVGQGMYAFVLIVSGIFLLSAIFGLICEGKWRQCGYDRL